MVLKTIQLFLLKTSTDGQASTCLLAKDLINDDDMIFIHSCDSFIDFNKNKFLKLINSNEIIIFTTKPNISHLKSINSYGWVHSSNNKIIRITCKAAASQNSKNDSVIIGSFAFKNKSFFLKSINSMISNDIRINNEYYLDVAMSEAIRLNFKIKEFLVDKYINWGTPKELENGNYNT